MGPPKHIENEYCVRNSNGELFRCTMQCFIMNENGQFLAGQMMGQSNIHFRNPVQGGIENGEDLLTTAGRELQEEMGIDINDLEFLSIITPKFDRAFVPLKETNLLKLNEIIQPPFVYRTNQYVECKGQYVFPIFFRMKKSALAVNFKIEQRVNGFQTFRKAYWVNLSDLFDRAPTRKKQVMKKICEAAQEFKLWYYESVNTPVPAPLAESQLLEYTSSNEKPFHSWDEGRSEHFSCTGAQHHFRRTRGGRWRGGQESNSRVGFSAFGESSYQDSYRGLEQGSVLGGGNPESYYNYYNYNNNYNYHNMTRR